MSRFSFYQITDETTGKTVVLDEYETQDYLDEYISYHEEQGADIRANLSSEYPLSEGNLMYLEDVLNLQIDPLI